MKVFKLVLGIFTFVFLVVLVAIFLNEFRGPAKNREKQRLIIKLNTPEEQLIDQLKTEGFLKNKLVFNLILDLKKWRGKIEPGAYMVSPGMNAYQLAKTLIAGPYQKWVMIPPGKRKEQVALILKKALSWPDSLVSSFNLVVEEGYLYPDTYLINTDADPQQIVQKLKANFNEKFDDKLQNDLLKQNIRNDTAIKIASLIERESGGEEDKPIIAGIIWHRLAKGMKLEIDATVQYAIVSEKCQVQSEKLAEVKECDFWPKLPSGLVRTIDSPYNTYLHKGLPPGPICTPSIASIRAVAYPSETDALYYLHSPDKKIHTAKTFKEHQKNIEEFLP